MNEEYETIGKILNDPLANEIAYKNRNIVEISGFIVKKPLIRTHDKSNTTSCSFVLYQIENKTGVVNMTSYNCMTFAKELMEQFEKLNNVIYIFGVGKIRYSKVLKGCYCQLHEIETLVELDIPLVERKKDE